jgi:hypothetical protein
MLKAVSHLTQGSKVISERIQQHPSLSCAVACIPSSSECRVASFHSLIPSRAPPPLRFFLA